MAAIVAVEPAAPARPLAAAQADDADEPHADVVALPFRLLVAPCQGRFNPAPTMAEGSAGSWLRAGQVIGTVDRLTASEAVTCPHAGRLLGMLALPGEPVHEGKALLWMEREHVPSQPEAPRRAAAPAATTGPAGTS